MRWQHLIISIVLGTGLLASFAGEIQAQNFPSLVEGETVTDASGELQADYLIKIQNQISQYPFPVRVVYLPSTQGVNLGNYASGLFMHWQLSDDSMLVVVALDRRRIGVHAGTGLQATLKNNAQAKEIALPEPSPSGSPSPGASPEASSKPAERPLDLSAGMSHLDLVPQAIENVTDALAQAPAPTVKPQVSDFPEAEDNFTVEKNTSRPPRGQDWLPDDLTWLIAALIAAAVATGGWFGLKFWLRWRSTQNLVNRFSLQGQAVREQLEQIYESLESVMPDFHGYQGETETTLKLFLKSIHHLQEEYEAIFDAYDEEVRQLGLRETREEAIEFFRELERKLVEGKQLHEQALLVLRNLKDVRAANQQLCEQSDTRRQAFSQEISELRKLHPELKLVKIQQGYQQALVELQRLEKQNERNPLGVEKKLGDWRKQLNRMETETRTLPHLHQQFTGDLKNRIKGLRERVKGSSSSNQVQSLAEIERLHKNLIQAIEQGDLNVLNRFNDLFTRKLQSLEAEV